MARWEVIATRVLGRLRLNSIRSKILLFALLATLLPSFGMGWLSYHNSSRALTEKITQELDGLTVHAARTFDLWLRERRYEVRVFSSSYEVSENLAVLAVDGGSDRAGRDRARARLQDYLRSVGRRFPDYEGLTALDAGGAPVIDGGKTPMTIDLPDGWLDLPAGEESFLGTPRRVEATGTVVLTVAQPVRDRRDRTVGFVVARIRLDGLEQTLATIANTGDPADVYFIDRRGSILVLAGSAADTADGRTLDGEAASDLFAGPGARRYRGLRGTDVVGSARPLDQLGIAAVAEVDAAAAFAAIQRLRDSTLAMVATMLIAIGVISYGLGLTIVRPLQRLTAGAARVAGGDLDVDLPELGGQEVVALTRTFNQMVAGLSEAREALASTNAELRDKNRKLHELTITDSLTGLFNRAYLNRILANELERSRRHGHVFAVLMMDVDRFKQFNDTHGHLAGDAVLRGVARCFTETVRNCDYVARFGGEEFLALLPEIGPDDAEVVAERIRVAVERAVAPDDRGPITISIGVACYPYQGDEVETIVQAADAAMYRAKRAGRNRVVVAGPRGREIAGSGGG